MSTRFKMFFTSPHDTDAVIGDIVLTLGSSPLVKTADSLPQFPVFEGEGMGMKLSLKRIENRGARGVYRFSGSALDGSGDAAEDITDKLMLQLAGKFESLMDEKTHEAQFQATQKFSR
jgi:hypothetical protein